MGLESIRDSRRRGALKYLILVAVLLALLAGAFLVWARGDYLLTPQALYDAADSARPARAAVLYGRLGERVPQIKEYAEVWASEAAMPDLEALRTLQSVIAFRPQSPAAYEAYIIMARYYAGIGAPQAQDAYSAALALNDTIALRLELARYLEERGDDKGAYAEYLRLLNKQPDAFAGVRRTGHDPLAVATDLIAASYDSDALDTLRTSDDPKAWPLRAQALTNLGRYDEAEAAYRKWLEETPGDAIAQFGLAGVLAHLDRSDEALSLYKVIDTADSRLAQADLLTERNPEQALALYRDSPYPVAWWLSTRILEEQGRLTEALPIYERVAKTDDVFADDAAYRLYVLAQRLGDKQAQAAGQILLDRLGLNWLALRTRNSQPSLEVAPSLAPGGQDILTKVRALESIGRADLAHLELVLAARSASAPEAKLAMAEALASRGDVRDAQSIAASYLADHPYAPLGFWQLSYPRLYSPIVQASAKEFQVDPLLAWSVMRAESRYDPEAVGYAGERGLMQVMPATQTWIAGQLNEDIPPGAALTPEANIRMGVWFLHFLLEHFGGDLELAIAAYNGGAGSVASWQEDPLVANRDDFLRWIGFGQTREYLEQVSLTYQIYQVLYGGNAR